MKSLKNNIQFASAVKAVKTSLIALLGALAITGVVIAFTGYNPFEIYTAVFVESFSSKASIALCLSQATPLIFAGLSFAIALKVGIINVGVEGQLVAGALVAAIGGVYITFIPNKLHVVVCLILAAIAGGLVCMFTIFLKVRTGATEVITGIMLNTILTLVASYLINEPLKADGASIGKTEQVLPTAELTRIVDRTQLTSGFIIVLVLCVVMHFVMNKTVFGYQMRATGLNKRAAAVAGIKATRVYYATSFISGAIAGVAGAAISLGVYRSYMEGLSVGYGFAGIPVAALAGSAPLAIPIAGILFGVLKAGTITLSRTTSIPIEIVSVIQGLVVVFVSAPEIITSIKDTKPVLYVRNLVSRKNKKGGDDNE